ncbi:2(OG)-Fe(II) oxygenase superfamily protein [Nitzschia inconspicua]|uniref:2(OG)-Fe(II) oxygenase superfamily protein n=1 Tax=Nitzschia inconspicua TaxID=303405 RepID=A0A9K3LZA5_9STRA|nr:2(OG)-Fe(II) oxygenase superfamily protein [Nitzschia inconspicua]
MLVTTIRGILRRVFTALIVTLLYCHLPCRRSPHNEALFLVSEALTTHHRPIDTLSSSRRNIQQHLSSSKERPVHLNLSSSASEKQHLTIPATSSSSSKSLYLILQQSFTVQHILQNVACHLTSDQDPTGSLSSLTLVRLSKHMIADDNQRLFEDNQTGATSTEILFDFPQLLLLKRGLSTSIHCMTQASWSASPSSLESAVEGIKAVAVIIRILASRKIRKEGDTRFSFSRFCDPLVEKLYDETSTLQSLIESHHLSGLHWAMDCFQRTGEGPSKKQRYKLPQQLQEAHDALKLPFRIRQGLLLDSSTIFETTSTHCIVEEFILQVDFQSDIIKTTSTNRIVQERRQTAWQGDEKVAAFSYSGKSMPRKQWSPLVETIRDCLYQQTSQYYDGCLLNLYPDGESGMRYHIDPDQGSMWGYETAVVSIGATRKFAFRSNNPSGTAKTNNKPHAFVLFNGDVTEMFGDCQERFQHTVKTADSRGEKAPRVSLVFKKTLNSMRIS